MGHDASSGRNEPAPSANGSPEANGAPRATGAQNGSPKHIAIIMDGNGRWANERGLPRVKGHEQGAATVRRITENCARRGVEELTLYAFSMENWKRPEKEVRFLMRLLERFLVRERKEIRKNGLRFRAIGRLDVLPEAVHRELDTTIRESESNTGMVLRLALNYGGRGEIVDAVKRIADEVRSGTLDPDAIDEAALSARMYDTSMSAPDLLIRTAGEYRISNFLLWHLSYSEIHVSNRCWPEFSDDDLDAAIRSYEGRVRKFGALEPTRC